MHAFLRRAAFVLATLPSLVAVAEDANAQAYPSKPITFVVPFSAGGSSDVIARLTAEKMGEVLGQRFVIENVGGAGGAIALGRVAQAAPDGYTVTIGNAGTNAAAYTIGTNLKYTSQSFLPVGVVTKTFAVLAVKKAHPATTLSEFLAYAKANPGKVTLGHAGIGSSNYLACKIFLKASGVDVTLVSYRGAAPALNDALGGQIDGVCDNAASVSPSIEGGLVKGLAVAGPTRLPNLPNVPSAPEAGLPDFISQGWNVLFVPKGTSAEVIATLNAALRKTVSDEAFKKRLMELGTLAAQSEEADPAFAEKLVAADIERLRTLLAGEKAN
jgi:tripartite-type tricarboxylate transporter receptor subunit TctC